MIQVGDIVKAKAPGEALYFEGVVMDINRDGSYEIDFGEEDEEYARCTAVQKVLTWNSIEVGSHLDADC